MHGWGIGLAMPIDGSIHDRMVRSRPGDPHMDGGIHAMYGPDPLVWMG